jgi:ADP-ribose pyrophosphatase YjhB (NUDIX family)
MPGETATEACLRHLKRELGITDVSASKVEHVSTQLFVWDSRSITIFPFRDISRLMRLVREQAPKEHGTSDVSVLVNVALPNSALAALVLEKQEYQAAHIFTLHDILTQKLSLSDVESLPPSLAKLYSAYGGFRFHPAGNCFSCTSLAQMNPPHSQSGSSASML